MAIHPGLRPSQLGLRAEAQPARPEAQPVRPEAQPVRPEASGLAGCALGLAGWPRGGTDGRMETLPVLQDFVPYWGRCPAYPMKTKEKVKQGKGTADHLMPLGNIVEWSEVAV